MMRIMDPFFIVCENRAKIFDPGGIRRYFYTAPHLRCNRCGTPLCPIPIPPMPLT